MLHFSHNDLLAALESSDESILDALDFGVVGMTPAGTVERYNQNEAQRAGLTPERVLGRHFFTDVAPCTNNFMVAARFEEEASIDATLPYVFTFRMRPTKVELRLLKSPHHTRQYILVRSRG